MRRIRIGLGQINNSFSGAHYFPYAAGLLQVYLRAHHPEPEGLEFAEPLFRRLPAEDAVAQLGDVDIAGLSLYAWNENLSLGIARRLKEAHPETWIVMGGPQVPDHSEAFLRAHPFVDVVVNGEGEQAFLELVRRYPSRDWTGVPGISFLDAGNAFRAHPRPPRIADLERVPSPYLEGAFDALAARYSGIEWLALWETNRGCPFQCTFCDWGSATLAKIHKFPMDRLKRELEWFAANRIEFIFCCDANFGILERDVELVEHAAAVRARTGYPQALSVQNTKNATDRAYRVQKTLSDAGLNKGVTLSMQSLDKDVLTNIRRQNISLDTYDELQKRFTRDGVVTYSDLILGLPGETYATFVKGVSDLIASGQHNRIQFNNLVILPNTEMANPAYRERFGLETVETQLVNIHGQVVGAEDGTIETQRMVVATAAMPAGDWRRVRAFAWMCALLYFDKLMQIPLTLLNAEGGIPQHRMVERFMAADAASHPTVAAIRDLFLARAAELQGGGFEYHRSRDWLDIFWPDDEYAFIDLSVSGRLDAFYAEAADLLAGLAAPALRGPLADALRINRALMKQPDQDSDLDVHLDWNVPEVWRGVLTGRPAALARRPRTYRVVRSGGGWSDWTEWCREVVWFGNKKGAYLYPLEGLDDAGG